MITLIDHIANNDATFRLMRLMEWAGISSSHFRRYRLDTPDAAPPTDATPGWREVLAGSSILVPMGNIATRCLTGRGDILTTRGYLQAGPFGSHLIPTVHPEFIQAGNAKWSAAFINDVQKAILFDRMGLPLEITNYLLDPTPLGAYEWAQEYRDALAKDPSIRLAFDIETPGKPEAEDESDTDSDAPDRTWRIDRIGFSYKPLHALSVVWEPNNYAAIRLLLGSAGDKVVWNAGFDVPRVRRAGVGINGLIHDAMVAWHILHTDLPKRLGFVATFTCPWQPAWKHLSGARPAYYNATDADVELRSMIEIERGLRAADLWQVYQADVLDLEPVLQHMSQKGMPVDASIRLDRARKLQNAAVAARAAMEAAVPIDCRRIAQIYKSTPKGDLHGLLSRPGTRSTTRCTTCGMRKPGKVHFKRYVKKHNPCADGHAEGCEESVVEYYRLAEFTPSRDQLIRYNQFHKRPLPMVWDGKLKRRKISFGERQIKDLQGKYPLDPLYPLVLQYREIDKIAGTYIGRLTA